MNFFLFLYRFLISYPFPSNTYLIFWTLPLLKQNFRKYVTNYLLTRILTRLLAMRPKSYFLFSAILWDNLSKNSCRLSKKKNIYIYIYFWHCWKYVAYIGVSQRCNRVEKKASTKIKYWFVSVAYREVSVANASRDPPRPPWPEGFTAFIKWLLSLACTRSPLKLCSLPPHVLIRACSISSSLPRAHLHDKMASSYDGSPSRSRNCATLDKNI